jgi:hypothetical protein
MNRKRLTALMGSAFLAIAVMAPAAVAADTPATYVVDPYFCTLSDLEGNPVDPAVIPTGSQVLVFQGWFANTRGQLQSFVNNVTWVLTVNGQAVDVTPTLSGLLDFGRFWADLFTYDAGTVSTGQTFQTHYDLVMRSANFDGVVHYAKGSLTNGGIDCSFAVA